MKSLSQLILYMKPYKAIAILGPLLMCVEVVMDLIQPTIMQHIIDDGIVNNDNAYVIKLGLLTLLTAFIGLLGGAGCSVFSTKTAVNTATDIRKDIFKKTSQFSNRNIDTFGVGKLITIVTNDITAIQQAIMVTLKIFVRGPLLFIGSVVIVWFTARELFPILLVTIPILIILIYLFSTASGKLFVSVQQAIDKVNSKLQETFSGIRVIKAFNRGHYEQDTFDIGNDHLTKRNLIAEQVILTLMPIILLVVNMSIIFGMWIGAIKVDEGTLQVGVILAFINYLNIIMNGLMTSSRVLMRITRSFTSANRIQSVLDEEIDIEETQNLTDSASLQGHVQFKNVCFSYYKNGEDVIRNVSFHAKSGETIGIIGATGSGKSTLMKLLPRLYDADSGDILINGMNIQAYPLKQLRRKIGFIPQTAHLFSGSIADNLRFGKENARLSEMEIAADAAVASEFIDTLDGQFEHELMQGATNLSGGQKQRLSMARAFIRQPEILIFDDSTSAVDALSEAAIQKTLNEDYKQTTKFIISAKVSSIIHADHILVIDDGKIEAQGKHDTLLKTSEVYRDIYATQSGEVITHE